MTTILPLGNDTARAALRSWVLPSVMATNACLQQTGRQQTLVIQPDMKLDGALDDTESGPGEHLETQVDG